MQGHTYTKGPISEHCIQRYPVMGVLQPPVTPLLQTFATVLEQPGFAG